MGGAFDKLVAFAEKVKGAFRKCMLCVVPTPKGGHLVWAVVALVVPHSYGESIESGMVVDGDNFAGYHYLPFSCF